MSNCITGGSTGAVVSVYYDDNFVDDYKEPNKAIIAITGGKLGCLWGGPIIVACGGRSGNGYLGGQVNDVDAVVWSDLAAFFIDCHNNSAEHKKRMARKESWRGKVHAVKATCAGEQALSGAAPYVPVQIPLMHPIFEDGQAEIAKRLQGTFPIHPSPITQTKTSDHHINAIPQAIDNPLRTWKAPHKKAWPAVDQRTANRKVCHMHKGLDPKAPFSVQEGGFGWSPQRWDQRLGNVLVMREDHQPLTPDEVDALGDFSLRHLPQYVQLMDERQGQVSEERMGEFQEILLNEASPDKWQVYLEDWRKVKAGVVDDPEVNGRVDVVFKAACSLGECTCRLCSVLVGSHHA